MPICYMRIGYAICKSKTIRAYNTPKILTHKKNGSCSGYRFTSFKRWFIIGIVNRYKCIIFLVFLKLSGK